MLTDPEKLEVRHLVEAGVYLRTAIRAMEGAISLNTTELTRPVLSSLIHSLLEADEAAAAALGLVGGAIVARGEAEKIALRLQPREVFVAKAMAAVTLAVGESVEASGALAALLETTMPADANIALALFNTKRALVRLRGFDVRLPYQDPTAWPGVDPVFQRDAQTHLWRSGGQYLYDCLAGILEGYAADPAILPVRLLVAMKDVLGFGWLIEDDLQKCAARYMAIPWVVGEDPLEAAQLVLLNDTSPRFQFMLTYLAQLLSFEAVLGRPKMQGLFITAIAKGLDAWKRMDYAASLAPGLGRWLADRGELPPDLELTADLDLEP